MIVLVGAGAAVATAAVVGGVASTGGANCGGVGCDGGGCGGGCGGGGGDVGCDGGGCGGDGGGCGGCGGGCGQGFLDYTTHRGNKGASHQNDTALFYDQIKSKLQLEFNKNQLVEKLRRLKKKYRNVLNKIAAGKEVSFKSPHDQATFEISRKIWSNNGRIAADNNPLDDEDPTLIKTEDARFQKSTPRSRNLLSSSHQAPPSFFCRLTLPERRLSSGSSKFEHTRSLTFALHQDAPRRRL
ncbi:uncharacterized protein LOC126787002 [Argentina anserina]|uniref:uncharacterized protein LOC126787002 n=1 Tax=Argentina anserina TaxID=57926 RepID=UPI0021768113|nr:uncharacterized protein LOC126787002 [Potentilla anserina]